MTDSLDRIEEWACDGYVHDQLAAAGIDVLALVAVAHAARKYDEWASRMPDAGFTEDDPRWNWWHERPYAEARAALARLEEPR